MKINSRSLFIVLIGFLQVACDTRQNDNFYMPAEWEPQEAVWFGWENDVTEYHSAVCGMIKALMPTVQIKIAVASDSLLRVAKRTLANSEIDTSRILFYTMPGERYWIRDHGATFLVNNKGDLKVTNFKWGLYGARQWLEKKYNGNLDSVSNEYRLWFNEDTGQVDSLMGVMEMAENVKSDIVIEGGSLETNGKGTLILCEAVTFQRNPDWSKKQLETEFKRVLGVRHIVWVKEGLAEDVHIMGRIAGKYFGGGTGGHTDEFVRFAGPKTILLAWVDENEKNLHPINQMNFKRMSENYELLTHAVDQDGEPFDIIKVPLPDPIELPTIILARANYSNYLEIDPTFFIKSEAPAVGDTLIRVAASSYLNYLVSNDVVLLPTYKEHGSSASKERNVSTIFSRVFPDRRQIFINCLVQNWDGGGIHCSTQQQPRRRK